jgi:hypothetical protein
VNIVGGDALDDGQDFFYFGEDTTAQDTQLGKQYGGIMIWQLLGDAPAPHSLLKMIEKNLGTETQSQGTVKLISASPHRRRLRIQKANGAQ